MTSHSTNITSGVVNGWVRLYTVGLPPDAKEERRDEIASDIWEQTNDTGLSGSKSTSINWQLLARMFLGISDDLVWRTQEAPQRERGRYMNLATHLIRPRTYINFVVVLISMFVLFPIGVGAFVAAVVAAVVPPVMLSAVFTYRMTDMSFGHRFVVDTLPEALVISLIGLVLVLLELLIANAIVSVLRRFVTVRIGNFSFGRAA